MFSRQIQYGGIPRASVAQVLRYSILFGVGYPGEVHTEL